MRLIDADALIARFKEHKRIFCKNRIEYEDLSDKEKSRVDELDNCIADVLNAPTVESERKNGHWIYPTDIIGFGRCEECKALWDVGLIENIFFRYCPRCGADMRGEENDT